MKSIIAASILTLMLLFTTTSPALAQGSGSGDRWVLGSNLTLNDDEVVDGDLVVFGGNVSIPESASVKGDLAVFGGNVDVSGEVKGDIVIFGGNANLTASAKVLGDIHTVGGNLNRAEGAKVEGSVDKFNNFPDTFEHNYDDFNPMSGAGTSFAGRIAGFFIDTIWNIFLLLTLGALSWLVAIFLPEQIQTVGDTITQATPISFGMGLLTVILAIILAIPLGLLIFTICLAIIPFAIYLLLGVALLLGWIVIGQLVGERLFIALERPLPNFAASTAIGVVIITAVTNMPVIEAIPILGGFFGLIGILIGIIIALTGLGAVVLTRYGTRPYLATGSSSGGSGSYTPYTPPASPSPARTTDFSRENRAEAELKARIKAALSEVDQEDDPEPGRPRPEEPSAEIPAEENEKPVKPGKTKKKSPAEKPITGDQDEDQPQK